ncbi:MaoC/PaaZ C-terminal domain-containing protein [Bradyrhizobium sp. BWA-3-5]|uniref:MaoC/PaaZ C-terminal domain-containing protein n=1 Tax=Bradyrhizobium sp. BWA-3-5 TaxID=3080013 RepID=UPI00293E1ADE|nr:MaoC/PaaZ C-terminal domain-containing protein [Bradyrhizobium sp. BWA-3-5]WOH63896.1 MaoC/PaaZ C-terminal domain-containing protein [Bradyrhizobium sp. BWA-3-5]
MIKPTKSMSVVQLDEKLPLLNKIFSMADLMAYGAATWDWHRLHYDIDFARSMKLPNAVIDGQAFGALFARVVVDWAGPLSFIERLSFKMKLMAFAGETLHVEGEVTQIRSRTVVVAQRVTSGGRVVSEAETEVRLPASTSPA